MSDIFLSKRVLKKKLAYVFSAWGVMPPIRKSINEAIEKSVAADVAPVVHAYWKGWNTQDPYCSNCGFSYDREEGEDAQTTDYCGNCGAKMDENEVENLERCPCGDRQYCPEVEKDENGKWFIRCRRCRKIVWGDTIEEAADAWNRRADNG